MSGVSEFVHAFHLIRPWVLIGLAPVLWLWWRFRCFDRRARAPVDGLAADLARALTLNASRKVRLQTVDLATIVLALLVAAGSGPTWSRVPEPFASQTAPLVVVLQVTPSMTENDVAPSRIARAKQKTIDLLQLRSGARTALVAFSGSAHSVVPMTEDPNVMQPYLEGLSTEVMPIKGFALAQAWALAREILSREETPGGALFLIDDFPADTSGWDIPGEGSAEAALPSSGFIFFLPEERPLPGVPAGSYAARMTTDDRDLFGAERALSQSYRRALLENSQQPWQDRGVLLIWPAALLLLIWFRRGVVMRFAILWFGFTFFATTPASAEGWKDWFLTADQQGWILYKRKDFAGAAEQFADPYYRGISQYKAGQYEAATETLLRLDDADAAFAAGLARIKSRGYRDGVRAFEKALELDPDHKGAAANLPIAKEIVTFVETTRAQSDTGEEGGIGADDTVFDNESGQGAETQIEATEQTPVQHLTTEQWMNTVDTNTGDFLRQRFRSEINEASE